MERNSSSDSECLVVTGHVKTKKAEKFENSVFELRKKKGVKGKISFLHTYQKNLTDLQIREVVNGKKFSKVVFNECSCGMIRKVSSAIRGGKENSKGPFMVLATKEKREAASIPIVDDLSKAFEFIF